MTSDDLDLRKGHLGLRTILRYVTDPNHVDSSAAYAFILGIFVYFFCLLAYHRQQAGPHNRRSQGILRRKGNKCKMPKILCLTSPVTRAAESESESESESVGVGCFCRSRSRSRQNLPTPTDSGQVLIPDSQQSPCRLFWHFSAHISVVDWLDDR